jgi:excisionase family DNA binding protein
MQDDDIFTVDQVAEQLALHSKTVRRFIQEGALKAHKVGKQWRIMGKDLRSFIGHEPPGEAAAGQAVTGSSGAPDQPRQKMQVSTIIDLYVKAREEGDRLSVAIIGGLNSRSPADGNVRCDYIYYAQEGKARFVLYGAAKVIGELLIMLSQLAG